VQDIILRIAELLFPGDVCVMALKGV